MARDFDGVDDVIYVASQSQANSDFTMAIWANPDSEGEGGIGRAFSLFQSATSRVEFIFQTGGINQPQLVLALGTTQTLSGANNDMPNGEWNHWAVRFRTSDNYKDIVKNGAVLNSNTFDPGTTAISATMHIGANLTSGSNDYDGKLAMFMWWNYFLSLDEIKMAMYGMRQKVQPANLKMFLPMWGNQSPEPDWSGNNRHGTVVGAIRADHPPKISAVWSNPIRVQRVPAVAGGFQPAWALNCNGVF